MHDLAQGLETFGTLVEVVAHIEEHVRFEQCLRSLDRARQAREVVERLLGRGARGAEAELDDEGLQEREVCLGLRIRGWRGEEAVNRRRGGTMRGRWLGKQRRLLADILIAGFFGSNCALREIVKTVPGYRLRMMRRLCRRCVSHAPLAVSTSIWAWRRSDSAQEGWTQRI